MTRPVENKDTAQLMWQLREGLPPQDTAQPQGGGWRVSAQGEGAEPPLKKADGLFGWKWSC